MARIRYLKPDFFKDEHLKDLPYEARLFYAGLWCWADKEGRLEDRPERLKVEVFPYDKIDIDKLLDLLSTPKNGSNRPYIQRYEKDGECYIQILNWHKHQKPHHTEKDSIIPKPPPLTTPLNTKIKGMGMEKQHEATTELSNGDITVKKPQITHPPSVILLEKEYENLITTYGIGITKKYIEDLNLYSQAKPKKFREYASHSAVIQSWMRRDNVKKLPPKPKELPTERFVPPTAEDCAKLKALIGKIGGPK